MALHSELFRPLSSVGRSCILAPDRPRGSGFGHGSKGGPVAGNARPCRLLRLSLKRPFSRGGEEQVALRRTHAPRTGGMKMKDRKSTRLNSSHLGISYAVF